MAVESHDKHGRRFSMFCSGLSLLLLPFVVGLWVQSYAIGGQVGYRSVGAAGSVTKTTLGSYGGRLSLTRSGWDGGDPGETSGWLAEGRHPRPGYAVAGFAGFEHRKVTGPGRWLWEVRVPMWAFVAVLAVLPVVQFKNYRTRQRLLGLNVCRRCGYDLRATPERCPECGAAAKPNAPVMTTDQV